MNEPTIPHRARIAIRIALVLACAVPAIACGEETKTNPTSRNGRSDKATPAQPPEVGPDADTSSGTDAEAGGALPSGGKLIIKRSGGTPPATNRYIADSPLMLFDLLQYAARKEDYKAVYKLLDRETRARLARTRERDLDALEKRYRARLIEPDAYRKQKKFVTGWQVLQRYREIVPLKAGEPSFSDPNHCTLPAYVDGGAEHLPLRLVREEGEWRLDVTGSNRDRSGARGAPDR